MEWFDALVQQLGGYLPFLLCFLVLGGLMVILIVSIHAIWRGRKRRIASEAEKNEPEMDLRTLPYEINHRLLTHAERRFYFALLEYLDGAFTVFAKVSLGDVFEVSRNAADGVLRHLNRINRKHVDFLICDSKTLVPICGVELDDSTHQQAQRQERDHFIDRVYESARLPLWHAAIVPDYSYEYFDRSLGDILFFEEEELE